MNQYISEEDFEAQPSSLQNEPVAIEKKHAYKTVVLNPNNSIPQKNSIEPDVISYSNLTDKGVALPSGGLNDAGGKNLDKINNLAQKEISLSRVGVTREKAYKVIASALDAKKWMDVIDVQGNVKREYVDDLEKQRWGAEMAIKMFGDMIERKEIEYDIGDRTLDKFRAMSVVDLKARAADLLLGKKGVLSSVTDAEVVR